jgi:hypothetical protein
MGHSVGELNNYTLRQLYLWADAATRRIQRQADAMDR